MVGQRVQKRGSKRPQGKTKHASTSKSKHRMRQQSPYHRPGSQKPSSSFSSPRSTSELPCEEKNGAQIDDTMQDTQESHAESAEARTIRTQEILKKHLAVLLRSRDYPKTICPSEVPRALSEAELDNVGGPDWRDLMDPVRMLLSEMQANGQVEILQKGEAIDPSMALKDVRGPIRARLVQSNKG